MEFDIFVPSRLISQVPLEYERIRLYHMPLGSIKESHHLEVYKHSEGEWKGEHQQFSSVYQTNLHLFLSTFYPY